MTFWTFRSTTGDLTEAALIHFTGVLGIHRRSLAYKSAYVYTPTLSALVWIGRLLFLEYALPMEAYQTLAWPWPSRDSYDDQTQRLDEIRLKYLLRGGYHPMGEIITMRAYGKQIVKKEGARANLAWDPDGQSFSIHGRTSLGAVKDDLTRRTAGWSFLNEESNGLCLAYKSLSRRAWTISALGLAKEGRWLPLGYTRYIVATARLSSDLFTAIHVTAGLPARGPEITKVRVQNTTKTLRNVFLIHGQLFIEVACVRQSRLACARAVACARSGLRTPEMACVRQSRLACARAVACERDGLRAQGSMSQQ
jgi:hypothetical protein